MTQDDPPENLVMNNNEALKNGCRSSPNSLFSRTASFQFAGSQWGYPPPLSPTVQPDYTGQALECFSINIYIPFHQNVNSKLSVFHMNLIAGCAQRHLQNRSFSC
jgi:hypothetical protein